MKITDEEKDEASREKLESDTHLWCCSNCNAPLMENEDEICEDCLEEMERVSNLRKIQKEFQNLLDNPPNKYAEGICLLVSDEACRYLSIAAQYWPKFSGSFRFPIPATSWLITFDNFIIKSKAPQKQYTCGAPRWAGEQKKLRQELLKFLIERIEREIND